VAEKFGERLALDAVGNRHECSIAPMQRFDVMPGKGVWIGRDQIIERRAKRIILRKQKSLAGADR
jgi:hypothetical protein